jgi:5-hydroxyisourate hydrolase-like protein (transthyretin family)
LSKSLFLYKTNFYILCRSNFMKSHPCLSRIQGVTSMMSLCLFLFFSGWSLTSLQAADSPIKAGVSQNQLETTNSDGWELQRLKTELERAQSRLQQGLINTPEQRTTLVSRLQSFIARLSQLRGNALQLSSQKGFKPVELLDHLQQRFQDLIIQVSGSNTTGAQPSPGTGSVSGTIVDDANSAPLSGIPVTVYDSAGIQQTTVASNSQGIYHASGLGTGNYFVRTGNSQGYLSTLYDNIDCPNCNVTTGTAVAVTNALDTPGIDFRLSTGGGISGQVTDASTNAPLVNVSIYLYNVRGDYQGSTLTDVAGHYSFSCLSAGTYHLRTYNTQGYLDQLFENKPSSSSTYYGTPISVAPGSTTSGINFALSLGARISGQVVDAVSGAPLSDIFIEIYKYTDYDYYTYLDFVTSVATNSQGSYLSDVGLQAGTYVMLTWNARGYQNKMYPNNSCIDCHPYPSESIITIGNGQNLSGMNFSLNLGGRISGTVQDAANGSPLSNVTIYLYDSVGNILDAFRPNAVGQYLTPGGVPAGNYYLKTVGAAGYVDQLYNGIPCQNYCSATSGTAVVVTVGNTTGGVNFLLNTASKITGQVVEAITLTPIAGGTVYVYNSSNNVVSSAVTDSSGNYSVGGLLPGTYYVKTGFSSLGYIDLLYNNIPCSNCTVTSGTPVTVNTSSTTPNINFTLDRLGRISGRVTNALTLAPLSGVSITAYNSSGSSVSSAATSGTGDYTILGLPTGQYFLKTYNSLGYFDVLYDDLPCTNCTLTAGTAVPAVNNQIVTGVNFALTEGGKVTGTVTDAATHLPLSGIQVQLYDSKNQSVAYVYSNSSGVFTISGLTTGTYSATVSDSSGYGYKGQTISGIHVTTGATTSGVNFALLSAGKISGTVIDAVTMLPLSNMGITIYSSTGDYAGSTSTNSQGQYTVSGLMTGTYFARTSNYSTYQDQLYHNIPCYNCTATSGTPIPVTDGATTPNINFALSALGQITGRIMDANTQAPLSNFRVTIYNDQGGTFSYAYSDSAGNYRIAGLQTGTYYVAFEKNQGYQGQLYSNRICNNCAVTSGTPVLVAIGSTTANINFALVLLGKISGTVLNAGWEPIAGQYVYAYSAAGIEVSSTSTDTLGEYTLLGLEPGNYFVRTDGWSGYQDQLYSRIPCDTCTVTTGTPVAVTLGNTTPNIDFVLNPYGGISGRVISYSTQQPLAGVTVNIVNSFGNYVGYGYTNSTGNYTVTGLAPGIYYALASSSTGSLSAIFDGISCKNNCAPTSGTPITVSLEVMRTGINFALTQGGVISGRVRLRSNQSPLSGIPVTIYNSQGSGVASTTTDAQGNYRISGLQTGSYFAQTNSPDYLNRLYNDLPCQNCTVTSGTAINVQDGMETAGINFSLNQLGKVSGRVIDELTQAPLNSTYVIVYNAQGSSLASSPTDATGNYTVSGLPNGAYYVKTSAYYGYANEVYNNVVCNNCAVTIGQAVNVTLDSTTSGINFALQPGGRISGFVTEAVTGLPVTSVFITIYDASGNSVNSVYSYNSSGFYQSDPFTPGTYYAKISNQQSYLDMLYNNNTCTSCSVTSGTPITVTAGNTTPNINFALRAAGGISGTVRNAQNQAPLSNIQVKIFNSNQVLLTTLTTNASGQYATAVNLPGSTYYAITSNSQGYINQAYNGVPCISGLPSCGTTISVSKSSVTTGIDFALSQGGKISGVVRDAATHLPIAGGVVNIYNSGGTLISSATGDTQGAYSSAVGLPTGTYYAQTYNNNGYVDKTYNNQAIVPGSITSGNPISITLGQTTSGVNFNLSLTRLPDWDFDGNHRPDLLWRNGATGENRVWIMNGTVHSSTSALPAVSNLHWKIATVDDFNGDGKNDIVWRHSTSGQNKVWYMDGTTFLGEAEITSATNLNWQLVGSGDFNCDGQTDLLWRNIATGENAVWFMNGTTRIGVAFLPTATNLSWRVAGTGDFNGDHKVDIAWRNVSNGQNAVWLMDRTDRISIIWLTAATNLAWNMAGVGDFNNDGQPDLLWRHATTGQNAVWIMNGTNRASVVLLETEADLNWKIGSQP